MEETFHDGWEAVRLTLCRLCGRVPDETGEPTTEATLQKEATARKLTMLCLGLWTGGISGYVAATTAGGAEVFAGLGASYGMLFGIIDCVFGGYWEWAWVTGGVAIGLAGASLAAV
jgi:hypothetical protein